MAKIKELSALEFLKERGIKESKVISFNGENPKPLELSLLLEAYASYREVLMIFKSR